LSDLARRLERATSTHVPSHFLEGRDVVDALVHFAGWKTDLVVMAAHHRGLFGRLCFGSVARRMLGRVKSPILFVRGYDAPADLTGDPALRHVLIPLDGTESAEMAIDPALALGTASGADHTLLRVLRWKSDSPSPAARQAAAWEYLLRVAAERGGRKYGVRPRLKVGDQSSADAILDYAARSDVDLIAMTWKTTRGWPGLLRRSVADQVIRRSPTPVLVVRGDDGSAS
jgi:nucleotide-binding universal stress UspA family protein